MRRLLLSLVLLGAVSTVACGSAKRVRPSAVAAAQARHEYPSPRPPSELTPVGSGSAAAAVRAFADAYINWTADSVSTDMRALAAASVGQARAATALAAAETADDYELRRGGIANRGTVEAVAPLAGRPGRYVVVTREVTSATATTAYRGLAPAWHVSVATVMQERPGVWVLSGWQPES